MRHGYSPDLTYVHDAGFTQLAEAAAALLLDELRERNASEGLVVDLGCGSGTLARIVTEAGYDVLGIDISEPFIDIARQRAPRAEFRCASLLEVEIPPCIAVTAIGECVNYLFDERHSLDGVWSLFQRVHDALSPGGLFLFDAAGPGRAGPTQHTSGHTDGDGWFVAFSAEEDPKSETLSRTITTFRQHGGHYRRTDETHTLRLIPAQHIEDALTSTGFTVTPLDAYGKTKFPPGWAAFLSQKSQT